MRNCLMKAGIFLLSTAMVGCSMRTAQSVPQPGAQDASARGPALRAPSLRPMDLLGAPTGYMNAMMADAAPVVGGKTVAHFYVGVREIDAVAGTISLNLGSSATPVQVDLLQYQNGNSDWMTQTSVPQQTYAQLRFVIDLSSTQIVFSDGTSEPVQVSTNSTRSSSGMGASTSTAADPQYADTIDVTVNAPFTVNSNGAVVKTDFNLTESLKENAGSVIMRPTLAAANGSGQITGTVVNAVGQPVKGATIVALDSNNAAVNSTTTDGKGAFDIDTVPPGTYQLAIYNVYTNAAGDTLSASAPTRSAQQFKGPSITVPSGTSVSAGSIAD